MENIEKLIPNVKEPFKSILIFGAPGVGKGTLAKFLSLAGNHCHLSSGDIFRGLSPESPAGKLYEEYAGKGLLVPDDVTIAIWYNYVSGLVSTNKYFPKQQYLLLDGLPRTINQAKLLDQYIQVDHILVLEVGDIEVLIKRLQRRAIIEKRSDDTDTNVLKKRMQVYQEETLKLLDHYPSSLISKVNADQTPLGVLRDVLVQFTDITFFNI